MIERIYQCILIEHDVRLVVLAALICLFACYTIGTLVQRALEAPRVVRLRWFVMTGMAAGSGIWATHFVAMLAYDAGIPVQYDVIITILSALTAMLLAGIGFAIFALGDRVLYHALAALVIGLGIGAMHYLGMSGMRLAGVMQYDRPLLVLSLVLGVVGAYGALWCYRRLKGLARLIWGAGALAFGICGLHFTAMAAVVVTPDPSVMMAGALVSDAFLIAGITLATMIILTFGLVGALLDRHLAERRALETQRLRGLANAALEGIVLLDADGAIVDANLSFLGLCGRRLAAIKGMPLTVCFQNLKFGTGLRSAGYVGDAILVGAGGTEIPTEIFFRPVHDRSDAQMVAIVRDIRERRAAEQKINFLSNHDSVTGLVNRALLVDRLEHSFAAARKSGRKVALYFIDIDSFKDLNAQLGHAGGDALLKEVAVRVTEVVREMDMVARLSADQFCILQDDIDNSESADLLALRLRRRLVKPFIIDDQMITVTACTGIAIFPSDADEPEDLLLRAEIAMKRAKSEGRGRYCFFERAIDEKLETRRALKQDLMGALGRHELFLVYQPQYRVADGMLSGFEVLLRWKHPQKGMISPTEFIPLAEESGVINDISIWILNEACREAASWGNQVNLAINLSPVQFLEDGLVDLVQRITTRHGLRPDRLELEITEGVLIADGARAQAVLAALKNMGVKLAMDDFGTGYSSLSYLQNFPFDKIKIDRSFVMQMEEKPQSAGIVRGMIGLAHGLGIPVLAEGVETTAQLSMLRDLNCDEAQGYLLGRPERIETYGEDVQRGAVAQGRGA